MSDGTLKITTLGRSHLPVPSMGFGAAPVANLYGEVSQSQAVQTIQAALEHGLSLIDTSPWYGRGLSETRVGLALAGVPRDQFVLSSKVGHLIDGSDGFDFSRDGVFRSVEQSLKRLGQSYLDIVHLHDPDDFETDALESAYPALVELRDQGVIKAIGVGMNQWEMLMRFMQRIDFDCFLLAGRYTLLEQKAQGFLDLCLEKNTPVLLGGVFNSGVLATGAKPGAKFQYQDASAQILQQVQKLEAACEQFGVSLKAAAIQFPLAHPAVTSLIIGAVSELEIQQNLQALTECIPTEFWIYLQQQGLLKSTIPIPKHHQESS